MLVDTNILLYSVDETSPFHIRASDWLTSALNGSTRVGLPWESLWAFVRIVTDRRAVPDPMTPAQAWTFVNAWRAAPASWTPAPGRGHADILGRLLVDHDIRGGRVSDAVLATICIEHGLAIVSADSDFARFPELTWINPTRG